MGQIVLNNIADGGSVNLTLTKVSAYVQVGITFYPAKKIPGSLSPKIDTDTYTMQPTKYRITAFITDAEKAVAQVLRSQPNRQVKLTDEELTNVNVRATRVEVRANPGHIDANRHQYPWTLTIEIEAEDH